MIKAAMSMRRRVAPIGLDVGSRSIKLVQLGHEHRDVLESSRWDWDGIDNPFQSNEPNEAFVRALQNALTGRNFVGRDVVAAMTGRQTFLQNIRVPTGNEKELELAIQQETANRVPYPADETEIRYWDCAEVRQGEASMREVLVFACHRPSLMSLAHSIMEVGLNPVAVDVEPAALLRSYAAQYRRDEDRNLRVMLLHFGYGQTSVMITEDQTVLFVKFIEVGGRQIDEAIAEQLQLQVTEANALRKRREVGEQVAETLQDAARPVLEKLIRELSMCIRYHSVTFRGRPISKLILSGGEISPVVSSLLEQRLGLPCENSNPFRRMQNVPPTDCPGQWEIAVGLTRRQVGAP